MSSSFLGGGEKGATSVLQNVGGRIEVDRSLFHDRYAPATGVAGPSRAARQPGGDGSRQAVRPPGAFDLSALRDHLSPQTQPRPTEDWARSFVPPPAQIQGPMQPVDRGASPWQQDFLHSQAHRPPQAAAARSPPPQFVTAPWQQPPQTHHQQSVRPLPYHYSDAPPRQTMPMPLFERPAPQAPQMDQTVPRRLSPEQTREQATRPSEPLTQSQELLARTARELVGDLDASADLLRDNPKLANSEFMQLMRGLDRGEVVVQDESIPATGDAVGEGAKLVERNPTADWASAFVDSRPTSQQQPAEPHQARTLPAMVGEPDFYERQRMRWEASFPDQDAITQAGPSTRLGAQRPKSVHFDENTALDSERSTVPNNLQEALRSSTGVAGTSSHWEESGLDLDDFDETAFMNFNGPLRQSADTRIGVGDMESWGEMQRDWEELQKQDPTLQHSQAAVGDRYLFQTRNPYAAMSGDADMGRESPTLKGVLELEAAVQQDPSNHEAWFALGLKQQENEREDQAIRALTKVIDIDPDYRPAYLALAVSYTNDGEHRRARAMLSRWIDMALDTAGSSMETEDLAGDALGHGRLVDRLIDIARRSPEEVDADVQIALGVLFNSSEEYIKAEDCFSAALSVRPDDWLLHNRLGATLANSGRSNEAISHYHRALSLHPNFVRALFNLGISYINLAQYPLAAQHIVSAIRLQHADATEAYVSGTIGTSAKGVTSDALWNSLRTACLHMGRHDLVDLAGRKDISAFPDTFDAESA